MGMELATLFSTSSDYKLAPGMLPLGMSPFLCLHLVLCLSLPSPTFPFLSFHLLSTIYLLFTSYHLNLTFSSNVRVWKGLKFILSKPIILH